MRVIVENDGRRAQEAELTHDMLSDSVYASESRCAMKTNSQYRTMMRTLKTSEERQEVERSETNSTKWTCVRSVRADRSLPSREAHKDQ